MLSKIAAGLFAIAFGLAFPVLVLIGADFVMPRKHGFGPDGGHAMGVALQLIYVSVPIAILIILFGIVSIVRAFKK